MESTTPQNPNPNYLKVATQIATITVAVLATLTTLGAVLVFTIHSVIAMDVSPRLDRLESGQVNCQREWIDKRMGRTTHQLDSSIRSRDSSKSSNY